MMAEHNGFIGITMGCPVGIGPEIILKFFRDYQGQADFRPVVIGDPLILDKCAGLLGIDAEIVPWHPGDEIGFGTLPVLSCADPVAEPLWGKPDSLTGRAMAGYIRTATGLALDGVLAAIVTCPISKTALRLAGYSFPGHTEMLAELCGVDNVVMMMAGNRLRVVLVTIHTDLRNVPDLIKKEVILRVIETTAAALKNDFGVTDPRIAVAGLNPHAGESGIFGREEIEEIRPAIDEARVRGIRANGPYPPDTVYRKAMASAYDAVVGMYHDQALIPFKMIHFSDGVNVTLGLPIVRTSVDHGTAYDIAGTGMAEASSLAAAYELACEMVMNRKRFGGQ